MTNGDSASYTLKEMIVRLEGKVDAMIEWTAHHEKRHTLESIEDAQARGSLMSTPVGRELDSRLTPTEEAVEAHERAIQRMYGAMALLTAFGLGTLALLVLRIAGYIPNVTP